jgi:hypothetical protein
MTRTDTDKGDRRRRSRNLEHIPSIDSHGVKIESQRRIHENLLLCASALVGNAVRAATGSSKTAVAAIVDAMRDWLPNGFRPQACPTEEGGASGCGNDPGQPVRGGRSGTDAGAWQLRRRASALIGIVCRLNARAAVVADQIVAAVLVDFADLTEFGTFGGGDAGSGFAAEIRPAALRVRQAPFAEIGAFSERDTDVVVVAAIPVAAVEVDARFLDPRARLGQGAPRRQLNDGQTENAADESTHELTP